MGPHAARALRGIYEVPARRGLQGDRAERPGEVRRLAPEARRPLEGYGGAEGYTVPTALIVPADRRARLRIAHRYVDEKRGRDHRREIVVEPPLMADRLEPQRDRLRGPAED